jgi:HK97 gp10 family phage protein
VRVVLTPDAGVKISAAVDAMLGRLAEEIAQDARRYAPRDTGALIAGIEATEPTNGSVRVVANRVVPGDDPKVPVYVEYGTRYMAAQPFMRPAAFRKRAVR